MSPSRLGDRGGSWRMEKFHLLLKLKVKPFYCIITEYFSFIYFGYVMKFWLTPVIKGSLGAEYILMWIIHAV